MGNQQQKLVLQLLINSIPLNLYSLVACNNIFILNRIPQGRLSDPHHFIADLDADPKHRSHN
jgi:hypothetical protein